MAIEEPKDQEEVINNFVDQLLDGSDGVLLSDYCNKYPLFREVLEQKYKTIRALEEAFTEEELAGIEIGEFLIIEEIGRGGMGVVYLALQQSLHRYVALKVLPFGFTLDSGSIKRFRTEAQIIARFNHPNIVPVYSTGQEKGIYYIAMALIPGLSLNKVLEGLRHFPPDKRTTATVGDIIHCHPDFMRLNVGMDKSLNPDSIILVRDSAFWEQPYHSFVMELCAEIANALSYAHRNGVCHGDLKPSNIMLSYGGVPMIVDFGLAKDMNSFRSTQSQDFIGTIAYASPEQVTKNVINPKSDIWSLGVTMYEMLSLNQPFRGKSVADTINRILKIDPPVLKADSKKFPRDMEAILFKCLEKSSESRYNQAELLKEDINNFLDSKPVMARPVGKIGRSIKLIKRNKLASLFICAALTILLIIGLYASTYYLISKGKNYVDEQKGPEAIKSYALALKFLTLPLFPKQTKAIALTGMGDAWSVLGDYIKAINYYKLALQIDGDYVPALSGMGDVYTEMRDHEKTIEFYSKVISLSPEGRNGYYQRGMAYRDLNLNREALRDFHRAIQLAPNDKDTKKEIFGLLLNMELQSEEAQAAYLQKEGFNESEINSILKLKVH